MSNSKNNNERIIFPWSDPFEDVHVCATTKVLNDHIKNDPTFKDRYLEQELKLRDEMRSNPGSGFSSIGIAVIKVYFHVVVTPSDQSSITNAVLQEQITALNADFRKTHGNTPARWSSVAADTYIEFTWDTSDINRVNTTGDFDADNSMKFSSMGGSDAYQPTKYLNIWICPVANNVLGYAQFPGGPASTDGVVVVPSSLKNSPTSQSPYNLGRTLTHEVGHWLNLIHIWGDGDCNVDDLLADTPTASGPSSGCPSVTKDTCTSDSNPDMWENYMDYTYDACMNMFTQGQADRMLACLTTLRPNVYTLAASSGATTTTTAAPGTLSLLNDYSTLPGGVIDVSSQNNWSNSSSTSNLVFGANDGLANGQNGFYVFSQDSTGVLTKEYSYVAESGQFLNDCEAILSRSGTSQVYAYYNLGSGAKIGLFDVNASTGIATLVASSSASIDAGWMRLTEDQNYLYLTTDGGGGVRVFDPSSLSLVTTISTPVGSSGTFESLASWSNDDYLFVASANQGIRVYSINSTSNTFTYVNTYGTVSATMSGDVYFDVRSSGNYLYAVGAGLNYSTAFIEVFSIGAGGVLTKVVGHVDSSSGAYYACSARGNDIFVSLYGGSSANDGLKVFLFDQSAQTISEKASDSISSTSWSLGIESDDDFVYLGHYPKTPGGNGGIRVYSYSSATTTTTTAAPGATTTTTAPTTTTTLIPPETLECFSVDDIYCLSIQTPDCNKAITGEVRVISTSEKVQLEPLCDQSILDNISNDSVVTLCKGNCAQGAGELYVATVDPTCSVNGDLWIKINQSGNIINFYKKESGAWTEKDTDNPCPVATTTTTTPAPTTTTTTTLSPSRISILSPTSTYKELSHVPLLSVVITGPSGGYDHWRWKLNASFPNSGAAGGNPVNSGLTATLSTLTTKGSHTINVALADSSGNMVTPAVTDSVEIVVDPTIFVNGNVPNWNQLHYYEAQGNVPAGTVTSGSSKFKAWGAPAAAAAQLGHLNYSHSFNAPTQSSMHRHGINDGVDAGSANQSDTGTKTISWNSTVANNGGHGWGDYLADGDIWRPTINTIPSWYSINPATIGGCTLTDFGWFMNTNNSSEDVTQPSPAGTRIGDGLIDHTAGGVGTTTHNVYKGLKDFYRTAGYDDIVGIIYHIGADGSNSSYPSNVVLPSGVPEQPVGIKPKYWTDNNFDAIYFSGNYKTAGANSDASWQIIKSEIDSSRTIIAVMQGWDIQEMTYTPHSSFPNTLHDTEKASLANSGGDGISYYKIKAEASSNAYNNESYTTSGDSPTIPLWGGTTLGHAVLIVGYIPAGAPDDISTNKDTDWLILRDNDEQTERNVIIPFKSATSSPTNNVDTVRWGFDCLMATVYTDPSQTTASLATCTTTTTTAGPTTTTTSTTTTTAAPSDKLCLSGSTGSFSERINGTYDKQNTYFNGRTWYKRTTDLSGDVGVVQFKYDTPYTGQGKWYVEYLYNGAWTQAYSASGAPLYPTEVSSWDITPNLGVTGTLSVNANACSTEPASGASYCISDSTATSNDSAVNGNWWTYGSNHEGAAQYWNQGRNSINLYLWRTPVGSSGEYSWNISTASSGGGTVWLTSSSSASSTPLVGSSGWSITVNSYPCSS